MTESRCKLSTNTEFFSSLHILATSYPSRYLRSDCLFVKELSGALEALKEAKPASAMIVLLFLS